MLRRIHSFEAELPGCSDAKAVLKQHSILSHLGFSSDRGQDLAVFGKPLSNMHKQHVVTLQTINLIYSCTFVHAATQHHKQLNMTALCSLLHAVVLCLAVPWQRAQSCLMLQMLQCRMNKPHAKQHRCIRPFCTSYCLASKPVLH